MVHLAGWFPTNTGTGSIKVDIIGLRSNTGQVGIVLHHRPEAFPSDASKGLRSVFVKIAQNTSTYTFQDIPQGTYAVSLFHDEDSNSKLNTNMFGIPKEGYGTSNNVKGVLGPPTFKSASFVLKSDQVKVLEIRMVY
jgi:uncharacterized protein (DUF2141 family)